MRLSARSSIWWLKLCGLQFRVEVLQHCRQMVGRLLRFRNVLRLPVQIGIEPVNHLAGVVHDFPDIDLHQLVQPVHPDMVGGAPGQSPAVVGAAGVGGL